MITLDSVVFGTGFLFCLEAEMNYNSKRWKDKRAAVLRRYGYLCQESLRYGKRREATMVHHVWPVQDYPEYAWCDWNLLPLSNEQHERMHDRSTGELTALGESWRRRVSPPPPGHQNDF